LDGGFTVISNLALRDELASGVLAAVPVAGVNLERELIAIARRQPPLPAQAKAFWRFLATEIAPACPRGG